MFVTGLAMLPGGLVFGLLGRPVGRIYDKVGAAERVTTRLNRLYEDVRPDEIILAIGGHSPQAILRSAQLIADAYQLPATPTPTAG